VVVPAGEQQPPSWQREVLCQVLVFLREMKKKKQQSDSENLDPPEERQKDTETQRPPPPNTNKGVPAPQPIKRGQKVSRFTHELSHYHMKCRLIPHTWSNLGFP